MMRFLQTHALALTPLTPIHIGCGEDFEPTNYVIDDGVLFHFDPATVPLGAEDRKKLLEAIGEGGRDSLRHVQKFFFDRREKFTAHSRGTIAVASGVAEQYASRIGQVAQYEAGGRIVFNALEIERTAHHPHTGAPYIPGSSLKGAMRTAWLNGINRGRAREGDETANLLERRLLQGAFHTDPFRLIHLADAAGNGVVSRVVFCTNQKKRQVFDKGGKEFAGKGPPVRREAIIGGQHRAIAAEIRFDLLPGQVDEHKTPRPELRIAEFGVLAAACNGFYLRRLNEELAVLESRRFATDEWVAGLRGLIGQIQPALDEGCAMLLRVGRHCGAESVTLDGVRWIKIMKKRGEQPSYSPQGATTFWLAADREDARSEMQPFGWMLVELADAPEIPALKDWCEVQPKPNLVGIRARLQAAQENAAAESARQRQVEEAKRERAAAEARAAVLRAERLASLSEQGRQIEALRAKLEKHWGRKQPVSGVLYAETQKIIKAALESAWGKADKRELADLISGLGFEKIDFGGKEKDIKRALRQLREES